MHRRIDYLITEQAQGLMVKQYLKARGYTGQSIIQLKKKPELVLVNGCPAYMTRRLNGGDTLVVHISEDVPSEKILPVQLPLEIVYEDQDLMIINKPAGMPIHPSVNNRDNSVANALAWYFSQQGIPFVFRCINRLDRDTSGLTVIAKHFVSAGILSAMLTADVNTAPELADVDSPQRTMRRKGLRRQYLAIARGSVTPPAGIITAPLSRKPGSILERQVDFEAGERAVTCYRVLEEKNGHSLVSLELETGRTHQIRIHMKYLGFPLIGDYLYNPDMEHIGRQALHAHRLSFLHPLSGRQMEFTAPLPEDMQRVLMP